MIADEAPRETTPSAEILDWRPPRAVCFVVNGGAAGGGVLVAPDCVLTAYRTVADLIEGEGATARTHCFFGSLVGAKGFEKTRDREVATIIAYEKQIGTNKSAPTPAAGGCALLRLQWDEDAASDAVAPAQISPHSPRPQVGEVVFVASRYDKWSPMIVTELAAGAFVLERMEGDTIAPDLDVGVCFNGNGAVVGLVAEYYTPLPEGSVYVVAADALFEALAGKSPEIESLLLSVSPEAPPERLESTPERLPEPEPEAPVESLFTRLRRAAWPALRTAFVVAGIALLAASPYLTARLIRAGASAQLDYDDVLAHADGGSPDTVTTLVWKPAGEHLFVGTRRGRAYQLNLPAATVQEIPEQAPANSRQQPVREIRGIYGAPNFVRRGVELSAGIGKVKATVEKVSSASDAYFPGANAIVASPLGKNRAQPGAEKYALRLRYEENRPIADIDLPPEMGKPADIIATDNSLFVIGSNGWIGKFDKASLDANGDSKASYEPTKTLRLTSPVVSIARSPDRVAFASSRGEILLEPETKAHPPDFPVERYGPVAQVALASPSGDFLLLALTRDGQLFLEDPHGATTWKRLSIARLGTAQGLKLPSATGRLTAVTLGGGSHYVAAADELGLVYVVTLDDGGRRSRQIAPPRHGHPRPCRTRHAARHFPRQSVARFREPRRPSSRHSSADSDQGGELAVARSSRAAISAAAHAETAGRAGVGRA